MYEIKTFLKIYFRNLYLNITDSIPWKEKIEEGERRLNVVEDFITYVNEYKN